MRRCNTGFEDGNYGLPSGHIEDNESISEGTAREISEEIGIGIHPAQLKLVHVMHRKGTDIRIDFFL